MRALGALGQCPRVGEGAVLELRTGGSTHVRRGRGWPRGREEQCRYHAAVGMGGSMLTTIMARGTPAHRGGAALTGGDEGEAQWWRSGVVEGGSAVMEIGAGGR